MRTQILAAAISAVALGAHAQGFADYAPDPQFTEAVSNSQFITMRDGTRLAVRVDRPAKDGVPVEGEFPVIWHHSLSIDQITADGTGGKLSAFRSMNQMTQHGYVVVQVARRGNGQSFGVRRGYHDRNESEDSFEVTQWLAEQPWSTGKVGVYGCSNTGDAAMHVLTMRPPALSAVFAGCFSWHKYDAFRRGGIFAQWGTGPTRTVEDDMKLTPVAGDEDKTLLRAAAEEHQLAAPLFDMWSEMPHRDSWSKLVSSRFWPEGSIASYAEQMRLAEVPVYIQGGWRDELRDQGFIAHMNLPGSRVVMGDWLHCENEDFALQQEMLRFFDANLKGIDTAMDAQPAIHYQTINAPSGEDWTATDQWPPQATTQTLALMAGSFTADYGVECRNVGSGSRIQPCHVHGSGLSSAGDVLAADTEVTGYPLVDIQVAADLPDANLFVYLEDVAPDGSIRVVTEGRLKASLRAEHDAPWQMPEGVPWHRAFAEDAAALGDDPVQMRFAMMPTSYVFAKGHRMQVTVTGSDHRERSRDPATPPEITLVAGSVSVPVVE